MSGEVAGLRLSTPLLDRLRQHAVDASPEEAVGLLGGTRDGEVRSVLPLPNLGPRGAFWADPRAQYLALRRLSCEGLELLAIYHSHPGGPAEPSPTDLAFAAQWPCCQVLIGLDASGRVELSGYRLSGGRVEQVSIELSA